MVLVVIGAYSIMSLY